MDNKLEVASQIWLGIFSEINLLKGGVVVEVAPGYEPKIGNALRLYGFAGSIYLIEPDVLASGHLRDIYKEILPKATVVAVAKTMQALRLGIDIPAKIDVVVASHPFDDMVVGSIVSEDNFFTMEKDSGGEITPEIKKIYDSLTDADYARGVENTGDAWRRFIEKTNPNFFIASQYPSTTLTAKGLAKRQDSGYSVLSRLKSLYKYSLLNQPNNKSLGFKADPKWWIVVGD